MKIDKPHELSLVIFTALLFIATGVLAWATIQLVDVTDRLADLEQEHGSGNYDITHLQVNLETGVWEVLVANTGHRDVGITTVRAGTLGQMSTHQIQTREDPLRQGEIRSFTVAALSDTIREQCRTSGVVTAQLWLNATSGMLNREYTRPCNGGSTVIEFYADGVNLDGR